VDLNGDGRDDWILIARGPEAASAGRSFLEAKLKFPVAARSPLRLLARLDNPS
jgi:hypothetical protein